jgi:hypothetical protein
MCSINHNLKAIYIHVPKTGGLYVEHILMRYYGFSRDYSIKCDNYGFVYSNNMFHFPSENRGVLKYYTNSKYINQKYQMTEKMWNEYTKFTFVRNPYTKIISAYEFLKDTSKNYNKDDYNQIEFPSFLEFIKIQTNGLDQRLYKNNIELYCYHYYHTFITQYEHLLNNENQIQIDYIGKFENLNEDLIDILSKIGVTNPTKHLNEIRNDTKFNVSKKKNVSNYIDEEMLYFINDYYNTDFETFGYSKYTSVNELFNNIHFEKQREEYSNKNKMLIEIHTKNTEMTTPVTSRNFLFKGFSI